MWQQYTPQIFKANFIFSIYRLICTTEHENQKVAESHHFSLLTQKLLLHCVFEFFFFLFSLPWITRWDYFFLISLKMQTSCYTIFAYDKLQAYVAFFFPNFLIPCNIGDWLIKLLYLNFGWSLFLRIGIYPPWVIILRVLFLTI